MNFAILLEPAPVNPAVYTAAQILLLEAANLPHPPIPETPLPAAIILDLHITIARQLQQTTAREAKS